ncbi:MAG TPA: DUF5677 domain-containing protein [bacterium]
MERLLMSHIPKLISSLIIEKIEANGVRLTSRQKKLIQRNIAAERYDIIRIRDWRWWGPSQEIHIEFDDADSARLEQAVRDLTESMTDQFGSIIDEAAEAMLASVAKDWKRETLLRECDLQGFRSRLNTRWHKPLDLLSMMLVLSKEFSEATGTRLQNEQTELNGCLVASLVRLHARACQVGDEILTLLRSGFADGAMARWRSLYEIAVTAMLIQHGGEQRAERYLLHDAIQVFHGASLHQRFALRLGEVPFDESEMGHMERSYNEVKSRFGTAFLCQYGWASDGPKDMVRGFADVEKKLGLIHLRPYYKLASNNVHAKSRGVFHRLGVMHGYDLLLTGPSNFGLADPGQCMALSLLHVTTALGSVDPTVESVIFMKMMQLMCTEISHEFVAVQKQIATDEFEA